jgi:hypothetical protein
MNNYTATLPLLDATTGKFERKKLDDVIGFFSTDRPQLEPARAFDNSMISSGFRGGPQKPPCITMGFLTFRRFFRCPAPPGGDR